MAAAATPERLRERLIAVLAMEDNDTFNATTAADAIRGYCEGAVCERIGARCVVFKDYYQLVFGTRLDGSPLPKRRQARTGVA